MKLSIISSSFLDCSLAIIARVGIIIVTGARFPRPSFVCGFVPGSALMSLPLYVRQPLAVLIDYVIIQYCFILYWMLIVSGIMETPTLLTSSYNFFYYIMLSIVVELLLLINIT